MGFFKKLKEKIFGSKTSDSIKKASITKEEKTNFSKKEDAVFETASEKNKYVAGLDKSSKSITQKITSIFESKTQIDEELFDKMEEILIMSDLGLNLTNKIIDEIRKEVQEQKIEDFTLLKEIIVDKIFVIYSNMSFLNTEIEFPKNELKVILMSGINGAGKTTTIAKLAYKYKSQGKKVKVVAGDTFRAAAVEQLQNWADKIGVPCIVGAKENQDPASIVFDALDQAISDQSDLLIIDTAGRLQNKRNLMIELEKIKKVISKKIDSKNIETILTVDAINGQNALFQAKEFNEVIDLDSLIVTKMDGTAKGGIILNIKDQLNIPVKFIGFGEGLEDLKEFDLEQYIYGLFKEWFDER